MFTLQTLSRQVPHRVALAASLALGLSLIAITVRGQIWESRVDPASIRLAVLAGQSLLLAWVLGGFRHALSLPAELPGSTAFSLAWTGDLPPYISGVKRAAWLALVLPAIGGLFIWHAVVIGTRLAALHLVVGVAVSALLMETLFVRYGRVLLASGHMPSGELSLRGVGTAVALLFASFALAWMERLALTTTVGYLALVGIMCGLGAAVRMFDRAWRERPTFLDLDESASVPTQRLNLAD